MKQDMLEEIRKRASDDSRDRQTAVARARQTLALATSQLTDARTHRLAKEALHSGAHAAAVAPGADAAAAEADADAQRAANHAADVEIKCTSLLATAQSAADQAVETQPKDFSNLKLTKAYKPISTRWLYEQKGVSWVLQKELMMQWCLEWQRRNAPKLSERWKRLERYHASVPMKCRLLVLEQFGQDVVSRLHAQLKVDRRHRLFSPRLPAGQHGPRRARRLPPAFCAASAGKVLRELKAHLQRVVAAPRQEFQRAFAPCETLLEAFKAAPEHKETAEAHSMAKLEEDIKRGTTVFGDLVQKWLGCMTRLPFLVCELGGDAGRLFALAFAEGVQGTSRPVQGGQRRAHRCCDASGQLAFARGV